MSKLYLQDCSCTFEGQKSFYAIDDQPVCGPCAGIGEEEEDWKNLPNSTW